jgi:hypothetical protein
MTDSVISTVTEETLWDVIWVQDYFSVESSSWAPVAFIYNPSYSAGRDQEDHGLKSAPDR